MFLPDRDDITRLIRRVSQGDKEAEELLMEQVYPSIRRLAAGFLRRERRDHTLQPSALANEAWIRLLGENSVGPQDRMHLLRLFSTIMRRILVDYARRRRADKRGGPAIRLQLDDAATLPFAGEPDYTALQDALNKLASLDERQAKIVEMRYFGGMTEEEIAESLGISSRTVKREWQHARAWLKGELAGAGDSPP